MKLEYSDHTNLVKNRGGTLSTFGGWTYGCEIIHVWCWPQVQTGNFDMDFDDMNMMVMEAICLSIQEHGYHGYPAYFGYFFPGPSFSEESYHSHGIVPEVSSYGGLACAAAVTEHQPVNALSTSNMPSSSTSVFDMIHRSGNLSAENTRFVQTNPSVHWSDIPPQIEREVQRWDLGECSSCYWSDMAEAGTSYTGSHAMVDTENALIPYPDRALMNQGYFVPESFEEQMMIAMSVSLADAQGWMNTQQELMWLFASACLSPSSAPLDVLQQFDLSPRLYNKEPKRRPGTWLTVFKDLVLGKRSNSLLEMAVAQEIEYSHLFVIILSSCYLERCDTPFQLRDVLELPDSGSLCRLSICQYPSRKIEKQSKDRTLRFSYSYLSHLLALLGSTICSEAAAAAAFCSALWSPAAPGAVSDGERGTSSENMDMIIWSASFPSAGAVSTNATESLADRLRAARLAAEKSRNSSTHKDSAAPPPPPLEIGWQKLGQLASAEWGALGGNSRSMNDESARRSPQQRSKQWQGSVRISRCAWGIMPVAGGGECGGGAWGEFLFDGTRQARHGTESERHMTKGRGTARNS
ncbi:hypothetical protein ZIOFF_037353 [Zingiber officinale]|uniref:Uncharacterized protein n=1 Tax=Zingiber officinale TaxID=94328 RepID=A0A8J5GBG2_ZINOF|nr:hypothetical protein ZIOFF_037353 [Zingiber officinale]